ncbi:hypothetical protein MH117_07920 [Paenibacillus sp. ACRRX]|uniref:hypothetical protein n=1 Tax=unclassified Paenibacillus TaxID=185978 RepID=UPI001EF48AA4|nr:MULTISPECIES: hypothetical protein [unclassified Paenibacillus]MCG7407344.1 hypothetical protein [Paenibacillus sp. ACRRX]MDK8180570.1 hypothetical protein [Paenibacillus sp. UMB4589-SE434]
MKKRRWIFTASLVLTLALGTGAYAASAWMNKDMTSKTDRMSYMREMHPEMTEKQIDQMEKNCHGKSDRNRQVHDGSMMRDRNDMSHMMGQM